MHGIERFPEGLLRSFKVQDVARKGWEKPKVHSRVVFHWEKPEVDLICGTSLAIDRVVGMGKRNFSNLLLKYKLTIDGKKNTNCELCFVISWKKAIFCQERKSYTTDIHRARRQESSVCICANCGNFRRPRIGFAYIPKAVQKYWTREAKTEKFQG